MCPANVRKAVRLRAQSLEGQPLQVYAGVFEMLLMPKVA